ncbi:hypothetical protein B0H10DRAFT_1949362 [Mycena sp. CBHHK59/15]|nr:hypothetical protein B0H10DRAFT_1949362 [Mycena sp. CBHHK59/15]
MIAGAMGDKTGSVWAKPLHYQRKNYPVWYLPSPTFYTVSHFGLLLGPRDASFDFPGRVFGSNLLCGPRPIGRCAEKAPDHYLLSFTVHLSFTAGDKKGSQLSQIIRRGELGMTGFANWVESCFFELGIPLGMLEPRIDRIIQAMVLLNTLGICCAHRSKWVVIPLSAGRWIRRRGREWRRRRRRIREIVGPGQRRRWVGGSSRKRALWNLTASACAQKNPSSNRFSGFFRIRPQVMARQYKPCTSFTGPEFGVFKVQSSCLSSSRKGPFLHPQNPFVMPENYMRLLIAAVFWPPYATWLDCVNVSYIFSTGLLPMREWISSSLRCVGLSTGSGQPAGFPGRVARYPGWEIAWKSWIFNSTLPEQKPDAMRLVSRPRRQNDAFQVMWRPKHTPRVRVRVERFLPGPVPVPIPSADA